MRWRPLWPRLLLIASFGLLGPSLPGCVIAPEAAGGETPWAFEVAPPPGASEVSRRPVITVKLDRRVFPQAVSERVRLSSGAVSPSVSVEYDPLDRVLRVMPRSLLLAEAAYTLRVEGLEGLDGELQPVPWVVAFATGNEVTPGADLPTADWEAVAPLLRARCATAACHAGPAPAAGLDLASSAGVEASAVGIPSRQARAGTLGLEVPRGVGTLAGLPIIDRVADRGRIGSSYLLYKVLGDPHVQGERMPPNRPPLEPAEMALIRDWIRGGAPTR